MLILITLAKLNLRLNTEFSKIKRSLQSTHKINNTFLKHRICFLEYNIIIEIAVLYIFKYIFLRLIYILSYSNNYAIHIRVNMNSKILSISSKFYLAHNTGIIAFEELRFDSNFVF